MFARKKEFIINFEKNDFEELIDIFNRYKKI